MAVDFNLLEGVETQVGAFYSKYVFYDIFCLRALDGEFGNNLAHHLEVYAEKHPFGRRGVDVGRPLLDPCLVFGDVRGVDYQQVAFGRKAVHEQVVDHSAALVEHHAVEALPVGRLTYVVGEDIVYEVCGVGAVHNHFSHVGYVEHAAGRAHGVVLFHYSAVLDGHVVAGEWAHLCAQRSVARMKAGGKKFVVHILMNFY